MFKVQVKVKFGSKQRVELVEEGLEVTLTEPPEKGKANKQLIEVVAEYYKCPKSAVSLVSGAKSRKKVVEIGEIT